MQLRKEDIVQSVASIRRLIDGADSGQRSPFGEMAVRSLDMWKLNREKLPSYSLPHSFGGLKFEVRVSINILIDRRRIKRFD